MAVVMEKSETSKILTIVQPVSSVRPRDCKKTDIQIKLVELAAIIPNNLRIYKV